MDGEGDERTGGPVMTETGERVAGCMGINCQKHTYVIYSQSALILFAYNFCYSRLSVLLLVCPMSNAESPKVLKMSPKASDHLGVS